jgi:hypothetical protein
MDHKCENRRGDVIKSACALLAELEPRTGVQALLAAQMIGAQRLAMAFLERALVDGQTFDDVNANSHERRG